jgi:O-antigen/teichoic acid export membrane protein
VAEPTTPIARRAASDVLRQLAGRILNLTLGIFVTAALVRGLGDEDFGRWMTVLVIVQVAEYFTSFGLEQVTVRLAAQETDPERREAWVDALVSLRLALAAPALLVSIAVLLLLEQDTEMRTAGVVLAGTIALAAPSMVRVRFQIRLRNDVPVAVATLNSVLWGVAVLGLTLAGAGLVAYAVAFAVIGAVTVAAQVALSLRLAPLRLIAGRRLWPEIVRIGVPVGIAGLLVLAYARIDQVLVFELRGAQEAGLYGSVYRVLEQAHLVPVALMATLTPLVAAAAADPPRLRQVVRLALQLLVTASLGGLAVAVVLAEPIVVLLFGEDFRAAAPALPIFAGSFVVITLGYVTGTLVLIFELHRRFALFALLGLLVNVGLNLLLLPRYGFLAAAWTTLATEIVVTGPVFWMVLRRMPPGVVPWQATMRLVGAATGTAGALWALDAAGVPFGILLVLAAPLYGGLALATRGVEPSMIRELLGSRAPA